MKLPRTALPAVLVGLLLILVALTAASLVIGSHHVDPSTVWQAVRHYNPADPDQNVIRELRIPRTAAGLVVGVALGAAGALMQAMTRNPLAEPGLLGINAGAATGVVLVMTWVQTTSAAATLPAALVGAALAGALVLMLGGAFNATPNPVRLVLAGAALSTVLGGFSSAMVLSYPNLFAQFRNWDAGAVVARPWHLLGWCLAGVVVAAVMAAFAARSLDALMLGQDMGRALGASPLRTWLLTGTATVVLAALATAVAGPISFVGLAAPLIARAMVGTRMAAVLPLSGLLAGVLLMGADVLGRVLWSNEIQASIVAAALGAPLFVVLARRGRLTSL